MTAAALDLPFDEAIRFFRDKANVTTRHWHDVYAAAHSRAFMVAGAASQALVADFRAAIDKAISAGTTLADFRRDFDDIVSRRGWDYRGGRNWRSRVIFETNLRTAYAAGRYAQLTAPEILEAFPFWQYNHSGARHPRLDHLSWDGMTLRADDPFWKTNYPPNGWGCGCFVIPMSDRDLRRIGRGRPHESPDLVFRAEEVGGRTVRVPQGVDPGFEYNTGMAWLSRTVPGSQTVAAAPGVIRRFADLVMTGRWTGPGRAWVPVARVPDGAARALEVVAGAEVRLSAETIASHLKHRLATAEVYASLPEWLMETGTLIERPDGRLMMIGNLDGEPVAAALKIVRRREGDEIYMLSLRRTNMKQVAQLRRTGKIIAWK